MKETIEIIEPSIEISELQKDLIAELSTILPDSTPELIGSMAVPISGKSEVAVMIVSTKVADDSKLLSQKGYKQGPTIKGISYLSVKRNGIHIDVQIIPVNHKMIEIHRATLKKLREDSKLREGYQKLKKSLTGLSAEEYKKRKTEWIENNFFNN